MAGAADAITFGYRLYRERLRLASLGYVHRDPVARLGLAPGRRDPYPIYAELRAGGPMRLTPVGNWATTSHAVCHAVLRDRRFGVQVPGAPADPHDLSMLDRDPPDHTRLRRLAQPAFSPKRMAAYAPRIEATLGRLLDGAGERFDVVPALAQPLPIAVITDLLGIPDADARRFARIGTTVASALDGIRSPAQAARVLRAHGELERLFEELFALRRREPADDVISTLVAADDRITPAELVPLCTLLLVAGFETTVNALGSAVDQLLDHPDQWADLVADPAGLAGAVVEETLRYAAPVQRTARMAHEEVEVGGVTVRRHQWVLTLIGAANRDPEVYADADAFDVHRTDAGEHLAFSGGIHYCVGAPLARLELATAVRTLAERAPRLRRAGAAAYRRGTTIRGPARLPVAVG